MQHIEIDNVSLEYLTDSQSVLALKEASINIEQSEFCCLIGPSGCGKSTLLNILAGFLTPTQGEVRIAGRAIQGYGSDRGIVFQDFAQLFPWRTALENVAFGLEMKGVDKATREEKAKDYLSLVKLDGFIHSYPHHLSGGMQQRVAIARALAYDPEVLLMDEPFGALDAQTRVVMHDILLRIWEAQKSTVIFVTHDVDEALVLSDLVYVMSTSPGRIIDCIKIHTERPRKVGTVDEEFLKNRNRITNLLRGSHAAERQI